MINHIPYEDQLVSATGRFLSGIDIQEDGLELGVTLKVTDVLWSDDMKYRSDPTSYDDCFVEFELYKGDAYRGLTKKYLAPYAEYCGMRNMYLANAGELRRKVAIVIIYDMDVHSVELVSREESRHALMMARIHLYEESWTEEDYRADQEIDDDEDLEKHVNHHYYDRLYGDAHKTLVDICEVKGNA